MIETTSREQVAIIAKAVSEHRAKNTYKSPLMGVPLITAEPTKQQIEQLQHFAKQGVKVRLK